MSSRILHALQYLNRHRFGAGSFDGGFGKRTWSEDAVIDGKAQKSPGVRWQFHAQLARAVELAKRLIRRNCLPISTVSRTGDGNGLQEID